MTLSELRDVNLENPMEVYDKYHNLLFSLDGNEKTRENKYDNYKVLKSKITSIDGYDSNPAFDVTIDYEQPIPIKLKQILPILFDNDIDFRVYAKISCFDIKTIDVSSYQRYQSIYKNTSVGKITQTDYICSKQKELLPYADMKIKKLENNNGFSNVLCSDGYIVINVE